MTVLFPAESPREGTFPGTFLNSIVGDELSWDGNVGCKRGGKSKRRKQNNWLS